VIDAYTSGDQRVMASLAAMKENAQRMAAALRNGAGDAIDRVGTLLREHWEKQMMLHREITTDRIDAIQRTAYGAGALGLKALGASGGGCVVVVARAGTEDSMRELLEPLGEPLSYSVDTMGFTVIEDSGADA
jgi:D-glycero-alpha-D-manno-heptose-7-phosphate kinase